MIATINLMLASPTTDKPGAEKEEAAEMDDKVHQILQESVQTGRVGNLKLDPQYLVFEPQVGKKTNY